MCLKKLLLSTVILLFSSTLTSAIGFEKRASIEPVLVQDGLKREWCPVCGMNLKMFYKTSHILEDKNQKNRQYCSVRCLAVDTEDKEIDFNNVKVIDVLTQKPIPAKSAFYVVGSDIKGTMSKVSKLAFSDKEAAEDFSMQNGGDIVSFKIAFGMAQNSLSSDIEMVQNKKEKKVYPMGKKIFEKKCKKEINIDSYQQINELKADIKDENICGRLKEGELQALSLYLFEVKRLAYTKNNLGIIKVSEDEKCPICGMFVYKYPKWAAQIFYKDRYFSFDGVKDMMKYYFDNKDGISKMLVTEYYSQKAIKATDAYFVIGSDIYGPMGAELIPFDSLSKAKTFSMDHKGKRVLKFNEITQKEIYKLDE